MWITAIPIWAEAKNFQYNTVLNSCNLSLPCLYDHLSVLIGKQSLLYFSFTLVPANCSEWFFIDILLLVWAFGVISQWFVAFLQPWPLKMLGSFLPEHSQLAPVREPCSSLLFSLLQLVTAITWLELNEVFYGIFNNLHPQAIVWNSFPGTFTSRNLTGKKFNINILALSTSFLSFSFLFMLQTFNILLHTSVLYTIQTSQNIVQ